MLKTLGIVSALVLLFAMPQDNQTASKPAATDTNPIPVEAVHQANPVKPTSESLAVGKKWWGYDCAMCHGDNGNGKGSVAADMKLSMTDFTDPATLKDRTDGELFYIIKNGRGQMPPEGDRLKGNELWNMVNYVRSLAKKKPAGDAKAAAQ